MSKVFLGGTCNDSKWREDILIPMLEEAGIDYYNPVVKDWNEQVQQQEIYEREQGSDYALYVLSPLMTGYFSIAEVVEDSIKRPEKTIFHVMVTDSTKNEYYSASFTKQQAKSLDAVGKMVERNGGTWCNTFEEIVEWIKD